MGLHNRLKKERKLIVGRLINQLIARLKIRGIKLTVRLQNTRNTSPPKRIKLINMNTTNMNKNFYKLVSELSSELAAFGPPAAWFPLGPVLF